MYENCLIYSFFSNLPYFIDAGFRHSVTDTENLDEAQTNKGFQRDTSFHVSNERFTSVMEECDLRSKTHKSAKVIVTLKSKKQT